MANNLQTKKQEVFKYVELNLGGGMIDVELDPDHYETALTAALTKFRQRSDNSVEESYMFLPLVIDQNDYTLPKEVDLKIAATKLGLMGGELEVLTEEQIKYLDSWEHGTS